MTQKEYTAFRGADSGIKAATSTLPALGPKDILVKITHSGLCATDMAFMPYGCVLGHEGVGIVEAIGSEVTQFKIGERAGGGFHKNACGHCSYCLSGNDMYCYERSIYGLSDHQNGTIAEYYVGKETFLHKIPEGLASEDAAPLQCAGATVFNALDGLAKPATRVGIVGIGGLGHLAIQFAAKMGAEVVVFSTSPDKEAEAKSFGATEFVLVSEPEKISAPISALVVAGRQYPDWSKFLQPNVLARQGTVVPLGEPNGDYKLPAESCFWNGYNLHSSLVASRNDHDRMLTFAAKYGIKPTLEVFPMTQEGMDQALAKLSKGKMRYRGVFVAQ